ncbi:MAG TPA: DUF4369 domain-containing protein, partial [Chitinophaga sp.]
MKYASQAIALLMALSANAQPPKPFTLTAYIKGLPDRYVYLGYSTGAMTYKTDSVRASGGKFVFKGMLSQPVEARLYLDKAAAVYGKGDMATFFMEPAPMRLQSGTGLLKDAVLTGSATQQDQYALDALNATVRAKLKPLSDSFNLLNEQYIDGMQAKKTDAELEPLKQQLDGIKDRMDPYYETMRRNNRRFIDTHPDSYVSVQQLRWLVSEMPLAEGEAVFAKLSPRVRASIEGRE